MIHLDIGGGLPLCVFNPDKMHVFDLTDGKDGDIVSCPLCLDIMNQFE